MPCRALAGRICSRLSMQESCLQRGSLLPCVPTILVPTPSVVAPWTPRTPPCGGHLPQSMPVDTNLGFLRSRECGGRGTIPSVRTLSGSRPHKSPYAPGRWRRSRCARSRGRTPEPCRFDPRRLQLPYSVLQARRLNVFRPSHAKQGRMAKPCDGRCASCVAPLSGPAKHKCPKL